MEWFNKLSSKLQVMIVLFTFIAGLYAVLTPPMIVFKYYMTTEIRLAVTETIVDITEKCEKNKDDISTIRGAMNHYHVDVNRFWQRAGNEFVKTEGLPYQYVP